MLGKVGGWIRRNRTILLLAGAISVALVARRVWLLVKQDPRIVVARGLGTDTLLAIDDFKDLNLGDPEVPALDPARLAALAYLAYDTTAATDAPPISCDGEEFDILNGWFRLGGWAEPEVHNRDLSGLTYAVWGNYSADDGMLYAAIVFRGTSQLLDWCSNTRAISLDPCDFRADQYLYVGALVDEILEGLYDEWGPDRYVFAVGHSLGGGLAELAGYTSYISKVFVFDGSPERGEDIARRFQDPQFLQRIDQYSEWYRDQTGDEFHGNNASSINTPQITRVFEHGEGLAFVRLAQRLLVPDRVSLGNVTEYRTNLLRGGPVAQHSIRDLACQLGAPVVQK